MRPRASIRGPPASRIGYRPLTLIEEYVRAELRQGMPQTHSGIGNSTMASRLPEWIIRAGHRDEVRRGIARLRERLFEVS